ncbi:unnamed protein product [Darwinula stevensoni]|uniref:Zinc transporter 2 n=1 Tax=Darwinula stevensoni TaxID=69355 RepID=A0A7R8X7J6_9CRUS|nr:unnamed protein product [Darwinula stevensoni]CAG0886985.1 unnamed protein product [Darwinula stevensoni]
MRIWSRFSRQDREEDGDRALKDICDLAMETEDVDFSPRLALVNAEVLEREDDPPTWCLQCRSRSAISIVGLDRSQSSCPHMSLIADEGNQEVTFVDGELGDGVHEASFSHCHTIHHPRAINHRVQTQLLIACFLCLLFMVGEAVGGYLANSLAVMTDAAHMLSDFASFLISLFAFWLGKQRPTRRMSFGYHRAEILGALVSILMIWAVTGVLVYMAVIRVIRQDFEVDTDVMLIVSATAVAMNVILGLVLHGMCHLPGISHGHSHDHWHGHPHHKSSRNINVRAALIHVLGDLLQSVGVLIAAFIIHYKPEYKLADPICTFVFSVLVLMTTTSVLRDVMLVLMEATPRSLDFSSIEKDLSDVQGVRLVHNLRVWSLTLDKNAIAVHLAIGKSIDDTSNATGVLQEATQVVRRKHLVHSCTIQVEPFHSEMATCADCEVPK